MDTRKAEEVDWFLEQPKYITKPEKFWDRKLGKVPKKPELISVMHIRGVWDFYIYKPYGLCLSKKGFVYKRRSDGFYELEEKTHVNLSSIIADASLTFSPLL